MEKVQKATAAAPKRTQAPAPASDGVLVALIKKLLGLNYLKYGIIKEF